MKYATTIMLATMLFLGTLTATHASSDPIWIDKRIDRMTKSLDLSAQQKKLLREVLLDYSSKKKALKAEKENKIKALLSQEQHKKLKSQYAAKKAKRKERREKCNKLMKDNKI